ncbi:glycosyltransferase [Phytoactinopolyspora halotolerans]|uniref:Glycosyltransferase family 1 protein n=1 Tax=Phytoactinopolyspora halotolerans TaxID=1981512 RepID=A0A6L9S562_9ACTN|nr:glycosyltransferase [Phytoactinopolyspora halotolerans]NED99880.1 glycosyltransferase family 1 protein [Phytoactinopolyspora halotolerans]
MRILQAANFVAPHSGGIKTMLNHVARGYAEAGHDVVMLVPGERNRTTPMPYGRLVEIAAPQVPLTGGYRMITHWSAVEDVLAAVSPDRVEVSDRFTLARIGPWARRRDIPSVVFSHERLDAILRFHLGRAMPTRRVADAWNRRLAASFDTVVCTTRWAAGEFIRLGVRNLAHVPLGIDVEAFHPRRRDLSVRSQLAQGADAVIVVAVRLSPEKRPDLLVPMVRELLRRDVNVRLVLCGDGSVREMVAEQAAGLPVTMTGFVSDRERLATMLASADVVVAPGPYETFGLAALEAMASGTPVVASASGALPELVRGDAGRTAASDPVEMADAVVEVLRAGASARVAARRRAEQFSWASTVAEMLRLHGASAQHRAGLRGRSLTTATRDGHNWAT